MEQEYKWDLPRRETLERLLGSASVAEHVRGHQTLRMAAAYYDTPDNLLTGMGGALRLRQENDQSICCMKLPVSARGACTLREEYEVAAGDAEAGLKLLPAQGAPAELCTRVAALGIRELCRIDYRREAYELEAGEGENTFRGELTVDIGEGWRGETAVPISEMEFEYLSGSEAAFHSFALALEEDAQLHQQPRSKLARVLGL